MVSSFTTDNVGEFCTSHAFVDLTPFMEKSGIDPTTTFPAPQLSYTQFDGNQCALPLLSDAYGLYYNKDVFKAAGISGPPEDAVGVRRRRGEADQELRRRLLPARLHAGLPLLRVDDHPLRRAVVADVLHLRRQVQRRQRPGTQGGVSSGRRACVDKLGGFSRLDKYRTSFGDEFSNNNAFMTGQVGDDHRR